MIALLNNGYFQDGLKFLIYLIPLLYLIAKRRKLNFKYFWLFFIGLLLLSFGHFTDLCDEFKAFDNIPIIGHDDALHDLFEDMLGFGVGFLFFIAALYLEFVKNGRK